MNNIKDNNNTPQETVKRKKGFFASLLDGSIFVHMGAIKNLPFIFFITLLLIMYISNNIYNVKKISEVEKLKKEVEKLKSKQILYHSIYLDSTNQKNIEKKAKYLGLSKTKESIIKLLFEKDTIIKKD